MNDIALYTEAEPLYKCAMHIYEQILGPDHPNTAIGLNNLATLYDNQGKYEQAEPLYQRALQIKEKKLSSNHPSTVTVRKNYAQFLEEKRQRNEGKTHGWFGTMGDE